MATNHATDWIRVALVERQPLVRASLGALLDAAPGLRLVARADRLTSELPRADVLLLGVAGPEEVGAVAGRPGERPLLIVVGEDGPEGLARRAALAGARGFVSLRERPATLFKAIARVHDGEVWFDGATMATLIAEAAGIEQSRGTDTPARALDALPPPDRAIVDAVVEGLRNREIAERFATTEASVRHALTRIYRTLGVEGRMGLARLGLERAAPARARARSKPSGRSAHAK